MSRLKVIDANRTANEDDNALIARFGSGEEEAFLTLYRRHQGAVFRFALHMSGNRETAEEVTQEVFLSLLRETFRFDPARGSLEAFLIGAARNQVRRQERSSRLQPLSAAASNATTHPLTNPDLDLLRCAILKLPPKYREVVVLCDIEELSYADTALRLQCAIGTVRSRLHRARALLVDMLGVQKKMSKEPCTA